MAEIYLAEVETKDAGFPQGRQVALKIANRPDQLGNFFTTALQNEVQVLRGLHHPNVIHQLAIEETADAPLRFIAQTALPHYPWFTVMEYLPYGTLAALLAAGRPRLPLWVILEIGYALAATLDYVHRQRLVHLDIKPRNLMFRQPYPLTATSKPSGIGEIVLIDFGSVAALGQTIPTQQATFRPSAYLAPEWLQAARQGKFVAHPSLDVYALGVVLYQMFAGCLPFAAENPVALERAILMDEPRPPSQMRSVGEEKGQGQAWLDRAILATLHKEPKSRCSADQLVAYLDEARFRLPSPGLYWHGSASNQGNGGAAHQGGRPWHDWGIGTLIFLVGVGIGGAAAKPVASIWSHTLNVQTATPGVTPSPALQTVQTSSAISLTTTAASATPALQPAPTSQ